MNYPWTGHLNYYNTLPALALPLGWLNEHVVTVSPAAALAALNLFLLGSLLFTPIVLYATLRRLGIVDWLAVAGGLLITFLSPQHERLYTHQGLYSMLVVAVLLYAMVRVLATSTPPRRWYVVIMAVALFAGLLHTYFLLVAAGLTLGSAFWLLVQERPLQKPVERRQLLYLLVTGLLPLVLFRGWLALTDPVTDRPVRPYGFLDYTADPSSIFLPVLGPWHAWLQTYFPYREAAWEGASYVGLVGAVATGIIVVSLGIWLVQRRWQLLRQPPVSRPFRLLLGAAVLTLLLAMGLPFILPGFGWLLDVAGPLRQFRALGRLAWPYYYVIGLFSVYLLQQFYSYARVKNREWLGACVLLLAVEIWSYEAYTNAINQRGAILSYPAADTFISEENNYRTLLAKTWRGPADFQAILPISTLLIGTDKIGIVPPPGNMSYEMCRASYNLGLPLAATWMARASVSQTLSLASIFGDELLPHPYGQLLSSAKPLLLLVEDIYTPVRGMEQALINRATRLASANGFTVYSLPVDSLYPGRAAQQAKLQFASRRGLQPRADGLWCSSAKSVVYQPFRTTDGRDELLGAGSFYRRVRENVDSRAIIYDGPAPSDTGRYEISAWVRATLREGLGTMQVSVFDQQNQRIAELLGSPSNSTDIYAGWVRTAVQVRLPANTARVEVGWFDNRELQVDNLLMRPLDTEVFWQSGPRVVCNNFPLPTNAELRPAQH
ncbi:hypothetical protein [Hymenobacter psychrophilus]|nr:hypothetical protein [Hymenobacter psychrophilus]